MTLDSLIAVARQQGASDLHLEAGLPLALRVRGSLRTVGEPVDATKLLAWALDAGATVANDVWGLQHDPDMAALLASRNSPVILEAIFSSRSYGSRAQSAVIASSLVTARMTTT